MSLQGPANHGNPAKGLPTTCFHMAQNGFYFLICENYKKLKFY